MRVGIIGLGLIGGSFARTLVKKGIAEVYGADREESVMKKAELIGAIDKRLTLENARELDMLVLCIFPKDVKSVLDAYLPCLKEGATVTDFCGIKREIVSVYKQAKERYPNIRFVGAHPMAGREFSGIEHSVTTLYDKASMILVPVDEDIFFLEDVKKFFLSVGFGQVVVTDADNHDKMIAFTSQLCHVVSNNYIKNASALSHDGYSAGSYKDLTRVARLDPNMWSELMISNRDYILQELNEFISNITEYRDAIQDNDKERLCKLLADGNELKLEIDVRNKNAIKS